MNDDPHMFFFDSKGCFVPAWLRPPGLHPCPRSEEALNLLDSGVLKQNSVARTVINQQHGFACCSAKQWTMDCVNWVSLNVLF